MHITHCLLRRGKLDPLVYSMNDGVLHRRVVEGGQMFQPYTSRERHQVNRVILKAAHDDSGHNGFRELTQQSDDYITGKELKKTYGNIALTATLVNCTGLLQ